MTHPPLPDRYSTFPLPDVGGRPNRICRVLHYFDDGQHHAHELDMDLVGYGDSPQEALRVLRVVLTDQLAYARTQEGGGDDLIEFPAPEALQARARNALADGRHGLTLRDLPA